MRMLLLQHNNPRYNTKRNMQNIAANWTIKTNHMKLNQWWNNHTHSRFCACSLPKSHKLIDLLAWGVLFLSKMKLNLNKFPYSQKVVLVNYPDLNWNKSCVLLHPALIIANALSRHDYNWKLHKHSSHLACIFTLLL